jgi:predicted transcriptional regulator
VSIGSCRIEEERRARPLKRRSRFETKYDILRAIQQEHGGGEARPTHIMYKANVSWVVMQNYLDELESQELIAGVPQPSGHKKYSLTAKGIECLKTMLAAKSLFGEKNVDE